MKNLLMLPLLLAAGCATFANVTDVAGGRAECEKLCVSWGMSMTGMVGVAAGGAMGSGCICQMKDAPSADGASKEISAAVVGAMAAVQEERRRARRRAGQGR
jgi:hypothetical protein